MIDVDIACPICGELYTHQFSDGDMEDPAFVEAVNDQPWCVICINCDKVLKRHFSTHDLRMEFHESIICGYQPAIDLARKYIQQT